MKKLGQYKKHICLLIFAWLSCINLRHCPVPNKEFSITTNLFDSQSISTEEAWLLFTFCKQAQQEGEWCSINMPDILDRNIFEALKNKKLVFIEGDYIFPTYRFLKRHGVWDKTEMFNY